MSILLKTTTEPTENTERGLMNYLVNPDISEIDERETDPLTGNIIGAAIDVQRLVEGIRRMKI